MKNNKMRQNSSKKMNMNKFLFAILLTVVVGLMLSNSVYALGVTPGRVVNYFESGMEREVKLKIINNEHKDFKATIFARGELAKYVTLAQDTIEFKPEEESKEISYSIKLPNTIDELGMHEAEIVIRETGVSFAEREISVNYLVSVVSQLYIMVPYPGKYIKADLNILDGKPGEEVSFFVPVYNLGQDDISKVKAIISIFDKDNKIAEFETNEKSVKSKQRIELVSRWLANVTPGLYHVVALVNYDNESVKSEKELFVGEFLIKLIDISVKNFRLGEIAKFNILLENIGNIPLQDVYSSMLINDEAGKEVAEIKSMPVPVEALTKEELISYWDTEKVNKGDYSGKIILGYSDKSAERPIRMFVDENSIRTEIVGITAYAITKTETKAKISTLWWIIIILAAANVAWFIYFKRKKKK